MFQFKIVSIQVRKNLTLAEIDEFAEQFISLGFAEANDVPVFVIVIIENAAKYLPVRLWRLEDVRGSGHLQVPCRTTHDAPGEGRLANEQTSRGDDGLRKLSQPSDGLLSGRHFSVSSLAQFGFPLLFDLNRESIALGSVH